LAVRLSNPPLPAFGQQFLAMAGHKFVEIVLPGTHAI